MITHSPFHVIKTTFCAWVFRSIWLTWSRREVLIAKSQAFHNKCVYQSGADAFCREWRAYRLTWRELLAQWRRKKWRDASPKHRRWPFVMDLWLENRNSFALTGVAELPKVPCAIGDAWRAFLKEPRNDRSVSCVLLFPNNEDVNNFYHLISGKYSWPDLSKWLYSDSWRSFKSVVQNDGNLRKKHCVFVPNLREFLQSLLKNALLHDSSLYSFWLDCLPYTR